MKTYNKTKTTFLIKIFLVLIVSSYSANSADVTYTLIQAPAFDGMITGPTTDFYWNDSTGDNLVNDFWPAPPYTGQNTIQSSSLTQNVDSLDPVTGFNILTNFPNTFKQGSTVYGAPLVIGDNLVQSCVQENETVNDVGLGDGINGPPQTCSSNNIVTSNANNTLGYTNFITEDINYTYLNNSINAYYILEGQDPATIFNSADPSIFISPPPYVDVDKDRLIDHFNYLISQVATGWKAITVEIGFYNGIAKDPVNFNNFAGTFALNFVSFDNGAFSLPSPLGASLLPVSRSLQVGQTGSVFVSLNNTSADTALGCTIDFINNLPVSVFYQETDPLTNLPIGPINPMVDIPAGQIRSFIVGFTPNAPFAPLDVFLDYNCSNIPAASNVAGFNTLTLSADAAPVPDVIGLTTTVDFVAPINSFGFFGVGSVNIGATGNIVVSADDGGDNLPLTLLVCELNVGGACINPPVASLPISYTGGTSRSFAVFAAASGAIPNDPVNNRITIRFTDGGGVLRGATSSGVRTM